jgi:hypothetical protein
LLRVAGGAAAHGPPTPSNRSFKAVLAIGQRTPPPAHFGQQSIAEPKTPRRLDTNIYRRASLTPVNGSLVVGDDAH